jgi:hypothetical protein
MISSFFYPLVLFKNAYLKAIFKKGICVWAIENGLCGHQRYRPGSAGGNDEEWHEVTRHTAQVNIENNSVRQDIISMDRQMLVLHYVSLGDLVFTDNLQIRKCSTRHGKSCSTRSRPTGVPGGFGEVHFIG